jgi:phage shock protein C
MRDRLYRSRTDRMLFGVAGGLARYFGIDSSIVRLVWVLLFLAAGTGILLYIVAAVVIPEEPMDWAPGTDARSDAGTAGTDRAPTTPRDLGNAPIILGLGLVLVGAWLLLQRFVNIDGRDVWPIALLVIGGALLLGAIRGRRGA